MTAIPDPAALRGLELAVLRRLDGLLQGDHHGLLPGHGWDMAEARPYEPGDDVRRMDWNVTARTGTPHVRDTIVDRELETILIADLSASISFGTAEREKRDLVLAGLGALGFLVCRGGNRVGALVLSNGGHDWIPARSGRRHLYRILSRIQTAPRDGGVVDLGHGLRAARRLAARRGLVVVASDFLGAGWEAPLKALGQRHDVVAVEVVDRRELELPDVGHLTLVDPETGRRRQVDTKSKKLRSRYAAAAAQQRQDIGSAVRAAGADHLTLRTDEDWVATVVAHVVERRRRLKAATAPRPR